ncbi:hypothetical protein R6Q57_027625 [Mikania cordata]
MDPYAAQTQTQTQTYPPPSSSQLQPQIQDPYLYHQQQYDSSQQQYDPSQQHYDPSQQHYDPSQQHYAYYAQIPQAQYDQSLQYPNPNPVYPEQVSQQQQQPQSEQDNAPIHPPGVPVESDPNQTAAYQQAYAQPVYQTDPSYYYPEYQQPQQLSYHDAGTGHQVQLQWQPQQGQPGDYGPPPVYPPAIAAELYSLCYMLEFSQSLEWLCLRLSQHYLCLKLFFPSAEMISHKHSVLSKILQNSPGEMEMWLLYTS